MKKISIFGMIGIVAVFLFVAVVTVHATTAAPGTPDLIAPSDTGSSSTDNVTGDTTPTFLISCESGDTVTLYQDGVTQIGTGTCGADSVLIESDPLSEGTYAITAIQDPGGDPSDPSGDLTVTIDILPTLTSADLQDDTATSVKLIVTGAGFFQFGSGATTANAADLKGITYNGAHPYNAQVSSASEIELKFTITTDANRVGTGLSGGPLTFASGTLLDTTGDHGAGALTLDSGSITDHAKPVVIGASCGFNGGHTKVTGCDLLMSEPIDDFPDGANANFTASTSANVALTINDVDINLDPGNYPGGSEIGIYFDTSDVNNTGAASLSFGYDNTQGGDVIEDSAGVPNPADSFQDFSPPVIEINAPNTTGTGSITTTTVHINDPDGMHANNVSAYRNGTVEFDSFNCTQTDPDNVDCTVNITSSGTFRVRATDDLGNLNEARVDGYVVKNYTISTCKQLENMSADVAGSYTLATAIDCGDANTGNDSSLWQVSGGVPFGFMPVDTFSGSLDGGDNTITGLYINRGSNAYRGLFGTTADGVSVHDLTISHATVIGNTQVGALIGYFDEGGSIFNIAVDHTTITGTNAVGGIIGQVTSYTNEFSLSAITIDANTVVTGQSSLGGLVGELDTNLNTVSLSGVTSSASITVLNTIGSGIGGLVGYFDPNNGGTVTISDVHSSTNIDGSQRCPSDGCIPGNGDPDSTSSADYVGGLFGDFENGGATLDVSNATSSGTQIGYNYIGGSFGYLFSYDECGGSCPATTTVDDVHATGNVIGANQNIGGLIGRLDANAGAVTVSDSDATGSVTGGDIWAGGLIGFAALGDNCGSCNFSDSLDLDAVHATGAVIGSGGISGGLIGRLDNNSGTVTIGNSYASSSVTGPERIGGLIGDTENTSLVTLDHTHAAGTITLTGGSQQYAGGLVGYLGGSNYMTSITASYATGDVSGYSVGNPGYIGGFIGFSQQIFSVTQSYASGIASGSGEVGGFIGFSSANASTITDSYATGAVYGGGTGGEIGGFLGGGSIKLARVYATGAVTSTGQYVGGLAGELDVSASDSFSVGPVIAPQNIQVAGFAGYVNPSSDFTNNFYDKDSSLQPDCAHDNHDTPVTDGCTTITGQPNYFIANDTNAPLNNWSTDIWNFSSGYPRLVVFAGPGSAPTPTPTPTSTPNTRTASGGGGFFLATPTPTPTPTPPPSALTPASLGFTSLAALGLKEGDTISADAGDPDIYIPNIFGYKRLFLNPVIFSFYGHLGGFSAVKKVPASTRDIMITSGLFRNCETNDQRVYGVQVTGEDTGILHWVNTTGAQAVADDPEFFKKVFCINSNEFNWYPKGSDYTSVNQVPDYRRMQ